MCTPGELSLGKKKSLCAAVQHRAARSAFKKVLNCSEQAQAKKAARKKADLNASNRIESSLLLLKFNVLTEINQKVCNQKCNENADL